MRLQLPAAELLEFNNEYHTYFRRALCQTGELFVTPVSGSRGSSSSRPPLLLMQSACAMPHLLSHLPLHRRLNRRAARGHHAHRHVASRRRGRLRRCAMRRARAPRRAHRQRGHAARARAPRRAHRQRGHAAVAVQHFNPLRVGNFLFILTGRQLPLHMTPRPATCSLSCLPLHRPRAEACTPSPSSEEAIHLKLSWRKLNAQLLRQHGASSGPRRQRPRRRC